jgi:hypothetical protein
VVFVGTLYHLALAGTSESAHRPGGDQPGDGSRTAAGGRRPGPPAGHGAVRAPTAHDGARTGANNDATGDEAIA